MIDRSRHERHLADDRAAVEKQAELGRRELKPWPITPQRSKAARVEAFRQEAGAGAVEPHALGALPVLRNEQKHVTGDNIMPRHLHEASKGVEAFAHVAGRCVRKHAPSTTQIDHESARINSATAPTSRPSTTMPRGP